MKYVAAFIVAVFSCSALAGWTGYGLITELNQQPGNSQTDVFISANLPDNYSGCSSSTGFMLYIETARDERVFSMLLAAIMSGREVRLYYTGECHAWGMAMIKGIYVR